MKNFVRLLLSLATLAIGESAIHAGSVVRFYYEGDSTSSQPTAQRQSVSTLTSYYRFSSSPTWREQLDDFFAQPGFPLNAGLQGKDNTGTDYGSWIRGYIEAPATGQYLFGLASADNSELWLSTNHLATNKVLIAYEPGTGEALFTGNRIETRVSAPINLVQGQKYYFEVLHQHGGGVGYIQVGWQRPDGVQEIIPALHLAQYEDESGMSGYGGFLNYANSKPVFNNPANTGGLRGGYLGGDLTNAITVAEGNELVLPLDVIGAQPTTFVWKTNNVTVPGQNLSFFRLQHTPATYNGLQIRGYISNSYGSLTSAVTTVTVTPDTTAPTILTVDTAGNPNLVQIIFSEPVDPFTATNLSNYSVSNVLGGALPITSVSLSADQTTVFLNGSFNFSAFSNYRLRVQNVKDQATVGNVLLPNPTVATFTLTAPLGTTYTFDSGTPSNFRLYGNAVVKNVSGAPSGSGVLSLTDATRNQNGAALITDRRDIDQAHIKFKIRASDTGATVFTDQPWGDGFSINIAGNLPLGTFTSPQFGYSPAVPGNQLSVFFNAHDNSSSQPTAIGVALNGVVLTNILAGSNGIARDGIPSISNTDGHWAPVDINIHRDGTLDLAFDNVTLLTNYPTAWLGVNSAQVGIAAATRSWFQTHWIDDLYINFGEGDVGNVGLDPSSTLGGAFPENSAVKLVAVPTGAGPFAYQWYRNGAAIPGANNRIYTFTGVSGSGGYFYLTVSNAFSGLISSSNLVTIVPDLVPPAVQSARGVAGGVNQVLLSFNETLDPATATAPSTYSSPYFVVNVAELSPDGRSVILGTTQQRVGTTYPLTITGLKDAATAGNVLNTNITFISSVNYRDEIIADKPSRYLKLDETTGTVAFTQTAIGDTVNTNGEYRALPILGVPPLVPSASSNEFAVRFGSDTNCVVIPNGGDLNDFRGPWAKKSYELWFNAKSLPIGYQPGDSAIDGQTHAVSGLWKEGGNLRSIGVYLWNPITNSAPNTNGPANALLTFHAYNSTGDGPGSPFGLLNNPATYVTYQITTNVTYHVVAVMDGDPVGTNGALRLFVNSQLVAQLTNGIGQIYNHNGDVRIGGQGTSRSHLNVVGLWATFDGVIDEVSTFNTALSSNRVRSHYLAGLGTTTVATVDPTLVTGVDPRGNPNRLNVIFNQPVSAATATNLANYVLRTSGNVVLPITSAQFNSDLKTVSLNGAFNFSVGNSYNVSVQNVADILAATNKVALTNLSFTFTSAGSVGIIGTLTNQIVSENQTAQFSVAASGQTPYTYQWRFNGSPLSGQTNATLSFQALWNSGGSYSVTVSNEFSGVISSAATLTVLTDVTAPQITNVRAFAGTLNQIVLTFSEPVDPVTATNLSTYSVPTAGSTGLTLQSAAISSSGTQVTLKTSTQVNGQTNQLTVTGLRDRAHVPNTLNATISFASGISYRDEVLSEGAVRYWTFDESGGTAFNSLVTQYDTDPLNYVGLINGSPTLGSVGLVPNVPNNKAITFGTGSSTNSSVDLPNGKDLTAILGPWPKITHVFSFKANSLPRAYGDTNAEAPAIYGHGAVAIYLFGIQDTNTPTQALLVFKANNTVSDGPGAPWGGNTTSTAKYITYPVVVGQVYNVVAVVDGNSSFTGQLRLYVNGVLVGTATGIGQIYKHPNTPAAFAHSYFTSHIGTNYTIRPDLVTYPSVPGGTAHWADNFRGVIDEFAVINGTLSSSRITELYNFSQTNAANLAFSVVTNQVIARPTLGFTAANGSLSLSWPASASGFYVEWTTNLASGVWFSNPVTPTTVNGFNVVTQAISTTGNRFFRLHQQ